MSLVVCSNQDSDSTTATTQQSIYKPYSFRNALSSTYTIPKNKCFAFASTTAIRTINRNKNM